MSTAEAWTAAFAAVMAEQLGGNPSEWYVYLEDRRVDPQG